MNYEEELKKVLGTVDQVIKNAEPHEDEGVYGAFIKSRVAWQALINVWVYYKAEGIEF